MSLAASQKRSDLPYFALVYLLLIVAAIVLLSPLIFALSLALQGPTIAPDLFPRDLTKLDWGIFVNVFQDEPVISRWILNSFIVALGVTTGVLVSLCTVLLQLPRQNDFPVYCAGFADGSV